MVIANALSLLSAVVFAVLVGLILRRVRQWLMAALRAPGRVARLERRIEELERRQTS